MLILNYLEVSGQYALAKINDFDIISNVMIDFLKVTEIL